MRAKLPTFVLLLILAAFSGRLLADEPSDPSWDHEFTLYLWLPSIDGTLRYQTPGGGVGVDASDILNALDMAFMGALESRRGEWSVIADLIYLDLSDSSNGTVVVNPGPGPGLGVAANVDQRLKGWTASVLLGHALVDEGPMQVDLAGGLRYFTLDADATLALNGPLPPTPPPRTLSGSADLWDAIVAVRGRYALSDSWSVRYHFDVGTGDSDLTWQAAGGLVRDWDWGNVKLLYRHLAYDQEAGKLLQDFAFTGPLIGVGFRF
jgi:hypothetical protein